MKMQTPRFKIGTKFTPPRHYQLWSEFTTPGHAGTGAHRLVGSGAVFMTHEEACAYKRAHEPSRYHRYYLKEVSAPVLP